MDPVTASMVIGGVASGAMANEQTRSQNESVRRQADLLAKATGLDNLAKDAKQAQALSKASRIYKKAAGSARVSGAASGLRGADTPALSALASAEALERRSMNLGAGLDAVKSALELTQSTDRLNSQLSSPGLQTATGALGGATTGLSFGQDLEDILE